jgi:hypothetical protein
MKYLTIIFYAFSLIKKFFDIIAFKIKQKNKTKEIKKVEEFKKEIKEKVENGTKDDIDDLNDKLKF